MLNIGTELLAPFWVPPSVLTYHVLHELWASRWPRLPLAMAALVGAGVVLHRSVLGAAALGALVGGGASNVASWVVMGKVTDWILVGNYVYDLGDFALIAGGAATILLMFYVVLTRPTDNKSELVKEISQ